MQQLLSHDSVHRHNSTTARNSATVEKHNSLPEYLRIVWHGMARHNQSEKKDDTQQLGKGWGTGTGGGGGGTTHRLAHKKTVIINTHTKHDRDEATDYIVN